MSADNYFLVREDGNRFVVSQGFMSDATDPPIEGHNPRFDTKIEAMDYAKGEYSEYGVFENTCLGTAPLSPSTTTPDSL